MARKKKEELVNQPSGGWPKISQGSHLTVKTFEDGRTELVWDDEALMRDVQAAIASVEKKDLVDLVSETEAIVKKGRKKKTTV